MRRSFLRTTLTAVALGAAVFAPAAQAFATDGTTPADGRTAAADGAGKLVETKTLGDGLTGAIHQQGEHTYTAAISRGTTLLGVLHVTSGSDAIVKDYRVFGKVQVVLASDGTLTWHWTEDGDPLGDLVGTYPLKGGLVARVYLLNPGRYDATVHTDGGRRVLGKLQTGSASGGGAADSKVFDGVRVTLHTDGKVTSELVDDGGSTGEGTLLRTEKLSDGSLLKVYRAEAGRYRAEHVIGGRTVCVLEATDRSAACRSNGVYLVLTPGGQTYHWTGSTVGGARLGSYKLPNGKLVKLVRENGVYGLEAFRDGASIGTVWARDNRSAVGQDDVTLVVVNPDGSFSNHILGAAKQGPAVFAGNGGDTDESGTGTRTGTEPSAPAKTGTSSRTGTSTVTTAQTTVVPQGGVAAGAELTAGGEDGTVFAAATAGAAALAAAGLAFTVVVRRRTR
ncbi:hypothetical protein ACIQPQ_00775 [Streptomyces sp. NPDC091281]|uniref:hypothetical protein n=1 Tax=Streptomyces sp. NPDC091281 TaxID=3365985 RepID=UPI00382294C6